MSQQTISENPIIDVKEAINIARDHLLFLYDQKDLPGLLLEEVELTEDEKYWMVTFGFDVNREYAQAFERVIMPKTTREYKIITIQASTGKVLSMKIRKVS